MTTVELIGLMLLVAVVAAVIAVISLRRVGALHGDWLAWKDAPESEGVRTWSSLEKNR